MRVQLRVTFLRPFKKTHLPSSGDLKRRPNTTRERRRTSPSRSDAEPLAAARSLQRSPSSADQQQQQQQQRTHRRRSQAEVHHGRCGVVGEFTLKETVRRSSVGGKQTLRALPWYF